MVMVLGLLRDRAKTPDVQNKLANAAELLYRNV
jgi:hypothetical protein